MLINIYILYTFCILFSTTLQRKLGHIVRDGRGLNGTMNPNIIPNHLFSIRQLMPIILNILSSERINRFNTIQQDFGKINGNQVLKIMCTISTTNIRNLSTIYSNQIFSHKSME